METMKPQEKAKELIEKFRPYASIGDGYKCETENAKQCAIICVEEILKTDPSLKMYSTHDKIYGGLEYWSEVKSELEQNH